MATGSLPMCTEVVIRRIFRWLYSVKESARSLERALFACFDFLLAQAAFQASM